MKLINWKVRIKNPVFWVQILISIFTPILAYMGITVKDLTTWGSVGEAIKLAVLNPYVLILVVGSVFTTVIDPTSTGITDSKNVLEYDTPNSAK